MNITLAGCIGSEGTNDPASADDVTIGSQNNQYNVYNYTGSDNYPLYVLYGFANPTWGVITITYPDGTSVNYTNVNNSAIDFHPFVVINLTSNETMKVESNKYSTQLTYQGSETTHPYALGNFKAHRAMQFVSDCYGGSKNYMYDGTYYGGGRNCSFTLGGPAYFPDAIGYYSLDGFTWEIHYRIVPVQLGA